MERAPRTVAGADWDPKIGATTINPPTRDNTSTNSKNRCVRKVSRKFIIDPAGAMLFYSRSGIPANNVCEYSTMRLISQGSEMLNAKTIATIFGTNETVCS